MSELKVSQSFGSPESNPLRNHVIRCAEVPWVNVNYEPGATATEIALKMVFQYWQLRGEKRRTRFASLVEGYHGDTLGAVAVASPAAPVAAAAALAVLAVLLLPLL